MSEQTHPGPRDWLTGLCQEAGFTHRILQDVELEFGLMNFVAEGLGVTLARSRLRTVEKADDWVAWHRENRSKALSQYIEIVKRQAANLR